MSVEERASPSRDQHVGRSTLRSLLIVAITTAAMLVNIMNASCTSLALGTIGRELRKAPDELQWLVSAYTLSSGCLLVLFGRLADVYGRKKVFVLGSLWMTIFTLACAFANDSILLYVLRGLQGIGSAAMIPSAIGVLADSFLPSRARSLAFATFSAGAPVGAGLGLIFGGTLTQFSDKTWRSNFYLLAGLTFLCVIGALWVFDADKDAGLAMGDRRVDWVGAILVTAGLVLVVFVLSDGEIAPQKWQTPYIIICLVVGVVLIIAFLFWQHYLEQMNDSISRSGYLFPPPLMKLSLWKRANGRMAVILVIGFLNWASFLGGYFWVQLYYQEYLKLSPIQTMLRLTPMTISGIVCNAIIAVIISHIPLVYIIVFGTLLTGGAGLLFALIDPSASYFAFGFPAAIISVVGADFCMAAGSIFVAKIAERSEQSLAGALFVTMTQLGTSFGLTITTIAFDRVSEREANRIAPHLTNQPEEAQLAGYRAAQWTASAFSVTCAVLAILTLHSVGVVGHQKVNDTDANIKSLPSDVQPNEKVSNSI